MNLQVGKVEEEMEWYMKVKRDMDEGCEVSECEIVRYMLGH